MIPGGLLPSIAPILKWDHKSPVLGVVNTGVVNISSVFSSFTIISLSPLLGARSLPIKVGLILYCLGDDKLKPADSGNTRLGVGNVILTLASSLKIKGLRIDLKILA